MFEIFGRSLGKNKPYIVYAKARPNCKCKTYINNEFLMASLYITYNIRTASKGLPKQKYTRSKVLHSNLDIVNLRIY